MLQHLLLNSPVNSLKNGLGNYTFYINLYCFFSPKRTYVCRSCVTMLKKVVTTQCQYENYLSMFMDRKHENSVFSKLLRGENVRAERPKRRKKKYVPRKCRESMERDEGVKDIGEKKQFIAVETEHKGLLHDFVAGAKNPETMEDVFKQPSTSSSGASGPSDKITGSVSVVKKKTPVDSGRLKTKSIDKPAGPPDIDNAREIDKEQVDLMEVDNENPELSELYIDTEAELLEELEDKIDEEGNAKEDDSKETIDKDNDTTNSIANVSETDIAVKREKSVEKIASPTRIKHSLAADKKSGVPKTFKITVNLRSKEVTTVETGGSGAIGQVVKKRKMDMVEEMDSKQLTTEDTEDELSQ